MGCDEVGGLVVRARRTAVAHGGAVGSWRGLVGMRWRVGYGGRACGRVEKRVGRSGVRTGWVGCGKVGSGEGGTSARFFPRLTSSVSHSNLRR